MSSRLVEQLDLTGRVAVVTGGSRGIGRGIVQAFAEAGANAVVASRKLENCEAVAQEVTSSTGVEAMPFAYHAGRWDDSAALLEAVYSRFGRCDVLVNNAGMSPTYGGDLTNVTEELYDKTHAVNAKGPFRLCALFGERMAAAGSGVILNVTSAGSLRPGTDDLPYAMAKAALNALTLALAGTYAPAVRTNLLMPGAFESDITATWGEANVASAAAMNPMKRIGRPEDLANLAVFLASDAASYINGAQVLADGGLFRTL
jgi:NAD(P)-dependent dehydrogenase (short-subunit alcohol dehydrogenase family)